MRKGFTKEMASGAPALIVALAIDGLQAFISLGLAGVVVTVSSVPVVGWLLAPAATPLGLILGIVINASISVAMGSALIFVIMPLCKLWYPLKMLPLFLEVVPGINNLPVWTLAVLRCMWARAGEQKSPQAGVAAEAEQILPKVRQIMGQKELAMQYALRAGMAAPEEQLQAPQPQSGQALANLALARQSAFDGIRPAAPRDLHPYVKTA